MIWAETKGTDFYCRVFLSILDDTHRDWCLHTCRELRTIACTMLETNDIVEVSLVVIVITTPRITSSGRLRPRRPTAAAASSSATSHATNLHVSGGTRTNRQADGWQRSKEAKTTERARADVQKRTITDTETYWKPKGRVNGRDKQNDRERVRESCRENTQQGPEWNTRKHQKQSEVHVHAILYRQRSPQAKTEQRKAEDRRFGDISID